MTAAADIDAKRLREALGERSIVLVGLMGAGKSSIGRRLAHRLALPFVDADTEIEKAADLSIPEIFEKHGEAYFRAGEVRVVSRILEAGPQVLATGGGAYMNPQTREHIRAHGVSVWLNAELDVLMKRVRRRGDRPLLKADDPRAVLKRLMDERYPVYAEADLTVVSREASHDEVVEDVVKALAGHLLPSETRAVP